jgi:tRNA-dihydrouridine synthase
MVAQLYGKDPDLFYQAAHAVCELGFDGLDINMGCPSKSVASSGSGAGLIRTPELAHSIVHAARQGIEDWASGQRLDEVGFKAAQIAEFHRLNRQRGSSTAVARRILPISVKTRLGYDAVMVESWVEQLLQEQPAVISLHGRTLQQMYRGAADWSAIARAACLSKGTETLLFGNGDVQSLEEAAMRIRETGVDGVLVGRAVLGAPWFFRSKELARALAAGASPQSWRSNADEGIGLDQRFAVLLDHARQFQALFGPGQFHRMRKHLGWYCKAFPHAATLRARMFRVSSVSELEALLADYWAHRIVDSIEAVPIEDATMPTPRCS